MLAFCNTNASSFLFCVASKKYCSLKAVDVSAAEECRVVSQKRGRLGDGSPGNFPAKVALMLRILRGW